MSWLSDLWKKWYGEGTSDDRRNPFWRLAEYMAVKVLWAWTILDLRFFYVGKNGKWKWVQMKLPYRTEQNFWNGFLTFQIYLVAWRFFICPKFHIVFRPCHNYFLLIATPGILFDRGEFHAKLTFMKWESEEIYNPGVNAIGWNEGSV